MTDRFPRMLYLHDGMRACVCWRCNSDFSYPVYWEFMDFGGAVVYTRCGQCANDYSLVMSLAQAQQWDADIGAHFHSMGSSATLLREAAARQKELPQWRDL